MVYGRLVTSEYRAAVITAVEVLGTGVRRLEAARAMLAGQGTRCMPVELSAALVAAHDQLEAALRQLWMTLAIEAGHLPPGPRADGDRCRAAHVAATGDDNHPRR
ncbi:hypothetical protein Ari01nite_68840 [Paractinoplanes rishiriensis]|uniref:Uncharacterized protein n=1 Tax=Paractinoplanes rishiriensis TaxID=1050105 RepID=A0A919K4J0_9ACTN|nr:hypothetical protein Ari01nite_68840 [Actinoplanes rishiriensis]